jgi:hypothetical protein
VILKVHVNIALAAGNRELRPERFFRNSLRFSSVAAESSRSRNPDQ